LTNTTIQKLLNRHVERPATLVSWVAAPALIDRQTAKHLIGVDDEILDEIIAAGGADLVESNGDTLIDKATLREFWEIFWELPQYLPAV
jgi:hypothetical protein